MKGGMVSSLVLVAAAGLAACQTVAVQVEKVPTLKAVEIVDREALAPIRLNRIGVNLRRGTVIGSYRSNMITCSIYVPDNIYWNSGRILQRDIELEDAFFESLSSANFNVVGNPDDLFEGLRGQEIKPEYYVGAQIEDIRLNICENIHPLSGRKLGAQSGEGSVRVTWQVFSVFDRKVVYETETKGSVVMADPTANGEIVMIVQAFSEAAANLAADAKLVDLLGKKPRTVADIRAVADTALKIPDRRLFEGRIADNIDVIRRSVVTIDLGGGSHGSGFFISPTLIMTNHHVIANTSIVRVQLVTGRKILGEVVRQHPERDVALVQVEDSGHQPLPLRLEPVKITEEVYAVGSPLDKALAGTVSKGIVSTFGTNRYGFEDIQADVDIHGGNSGGALVDGNGNVVGVSYAGIGTDEQKSVGLNFFIPVYDALDKLNIVIDKTRGLVFN